jgi:Phage major capsid protein E/Phage portal protein, lambda family
VVPAMVRLWLLDQYDDAELDRKKVAAMFAGFVTRPGPEDVMGEDSAQKDQDGAALVGLQPGTMQLLLPGEDIKFSDPADVGGSYEAFQYRTLLACCAASLNLVETTARGAPAIQNTTNKRKARSLVVPHIALEDTILADEVQNVRAFGSESMLEGVQAVVNQRMSEMATKMDATLEHLRIGAIKGQILDADGSAVIYDLFTEFGVAQHTEIDFDLDAASPAPGAVKKKCHDIRRKIEDELGVVPYDHIHAMCGPDFFDDPTLGGLAFGMTYGRPEPAIQAIAGAPAIKSATLNVTVDYESDAPLA